MRIHIGVTMGHPGTPENYVPRHAGIPDSDFLVQAPANWEKKYKGTAGGPPSCLFSALCIQRSLTVSLLTEGGPIEGMHVCATTEWPANSCHCGLMTGCPST